MSPDIKNQVQQMKASLDQLERLVDGNVAQAEGTDTTEEIGSDDIENVVRMLKNMGGVKKETTTGEDKKPEDKKEEDASKSVNKSDEGTHGDDDAEKIIADVPPVTESNIKEVAKALLSAMKSTPKQPVKKSENSELYTMMPQIINVMKAQNEKIITLEKGIENILEGIGIADKVKDVYKSEFETKRIDEVNKVNGSDWKSVQKSIDEFKQIIGSGKVEKSNGVGWGFDAMETPSNVRKSFSDTLSENLNIKR